MPEKFGWGRKIEAALGAAREWVMGEYSRPEQLARLISATIGRIEAGLEVQNDEFKNRPCSETTTTLATYSSGMYDTMVTAFNTYLQNSEARQTVRVQQAYDAFVRAYNSRPTRDLPHLLKELQTAIEKIADLEKK